MKRLPLLFLLFLFSRLTAQISIQEAYQVLKDEEIVLDSTNQWVYGYDKIIEPNQEIRTSNQVIVAPEVTSLLLFIDETPYVEGEHPVKYVFFNIQNYEYVVVDAVTPPDMIHKMEVLKKRKSRELFLQYSKGMNKMVCRIGDSEHTVILNKKQKLKEENTVVVYPNPIEDIVNIRHKAREQGLVYFALKNLQGEILFDDKKEHKTKGTFNYSFNMNECKTGIYLLETIINNELTVKKIFKK